MASAACRCASEGAWRAAGALTAAGVLSSPLFSRQHDTRKQKPFTARPLAEHRQRERALGYVKDWHLSASGLPFARTLAECEELVYEPSFTAEMKDKVARIDFAKQLSHCEVFSLAPDEVVKKLIEAGTPVFAKAGTILFSQEHLVENLYILGEGSLSVEHNGKLVDKVPEGGVTGEVGVVHRRLARGTARVSSPSACMLVLSHGRFNEVMQEYPEELKRLRTEATQRVLLFSAYDFFSKVPIFEDCGDAFRFSFMEHLMYKLIPDGTDIFSMGKADHDGMFFIKSGKVGVYDEKGLLASLGAGDFFGEAALFSGSGQTRSKTVRALGFVEVFQLTVEDFDKVHKEYPQELAKMKKISKGRSLKR